MVLPVEPYQPGPKAYNDNDVYACLSDMHAIGRDVRSVMDSLPTRADD